MKIEKFEPTIKIEELDQMLRTTDLELNFNKDRGIFSVKGFVGRGTDYINFEDESLEFLLERVQNVIKGNNR